MTDPSKIRPLPYTRADIGYRTLFIRDLDLACEIGVHAHEKGARQRVRFNVELAVLDDGTPLNDDVGRVLSYEDIVNGIRRLAEGPHVNLVETLAEEVAGLCLSDKRVRIVRVRVEKLDVFAEAAGVGVEIERVSTDG